MRHTRSMVLLTVTCLIGGRLLAQSPVPSSLAGPVTMRWTKGTSFKNGREIITGNVVLNAPAFGAVAEVVTADIQPGGKGKSASALSRLVLEPLPGRQISGHYDDQAQGRSYAFQADHAVYTPDASRKGGGRVELTGHVVIAVNAPIALDGPFLTNTDHATVLLGPSPAYPQVQSGAGHVSFTPLKGSQ